MRGAALAAIVLSDGYLEEFRRGEYYALLLFATTGMLVLVHATHFVMIFLAVEGLSLALYVLTGFLREREKGLEAALKYFFLGSFSAAFLAYGMALIYGATGTLELAGIADALDGGEPPALALAGLALMLIGFGFKISAVPFHMWTPDVYEAAPTPVVGFMSIATKAAAFAAMLRVFVVSLASLSADWVPVCAGLAFVSMLVGNLIALNQKSLKRMLAFSSIAHAGYALVGFVAFDAGGTDAVLFYLLSYGLMNMGAFAVLSSLEKNGEGVLLYDLSGLAERRPWTAAAMALFMLSLAGVPATVGFIGKLYLFLAAVRAEWIKLAVFVVVYSAIAAFYYLRVIVVMYMHSSEDAVPLAKPSWGGRVLLAALALGVIILGLLPGSAVTVVSATTDALLR